tara:strand:+ start:1311 stop:1865 length:555 start_codon:yes stop_codon:yes gene_type:complete
MKQILFFSFCMLMFSCIRDDPKNTIISSPLDVQEFKEILEELYLVDAFVSNKNQQYHRDSVFLFINDKLQRMGKSTNDLNQAISYYTSKPTILDSITQEIRDSLELKFLEISHDEMEDIDSAEMINHVLKNYPYIKSHNVNKNFIFNTSSKDSILDYFSKNQDKLGDYTLDEFMDMINKPKHND